MAREGWVQCWVALVECPCALLTFDEANDRISVCSGQEHVHITVWCPLLAAEHPLRILLQVLPQVKEANALGILHASRAKCGLGILLRTAPTFLYLVQLVHVLLLPQIVVRSRVSSLQRVPRINVELRYAVLRELLGGLAAVAPGGRVAVEGASAVLQVRLLLDQVPLVVEARARYPAAAERGLRHLVLEVVQVAVLVAGGEVSSLLLALLGLVHEHANLPRGQVLVLGVALALQSSDK